MRVDFSKVKMMSKERVAAARARAVSASVKKSSSVTYASSLNTLSKMLSHLRGVHGKQSEDVLTMTKDEWLSAVDAWIDQKVGHAPAVLAALKKHATKLGHVITWIDEADIRASNKGSKRLAAMNTLPCGTVDAAMLEDLKKLLKKLGLDEEFYAVVIAWGGKLRIGEMGEMLLGDESISGTKGLTCGFLKLHAWKAGDGDENPVAKPIPLYLVEVIRACGKRHFGAGKKIFGADIDGRLRRGLPVWAKTLKWTTACRWTGPHVFRHGGSGDQKQLVEALGAACMTIFAQQTPGTRRLYESSQLERVLKKRRLV
jgi:hypothetical protein